MKLTKQALLISVLSFIIACPLISSVNLHSQYRRSKVTPIKVDANGKVNESHLSQVYLNKTPDFELADIELRKFLQDAITKYSLQKEAICIGAPIKTLTSLTRKLSTDYKKKSSATEEFYDLEEIKDMIRSSVIFKTKEEIDKFLPKFKMLLQDKDQQFKDKFTGKSLQDYRNYHFVFNTKITPKEDKVNFLTETQLHLCGVFLANVLLHKTYEARRILDKFNKDINTTLENTKVSQEEFVKILEDNLNIADLLKDKELRKAISNFSQTSKKQDATELSKMLLEVDHKVNTAASDEKNKEKCYDIVSKCMTDTTTCSIDSDKILKASEEFLKELMIPKK